MPRRSPPPRWMWWPTRTRWGRCCTTCSPGPTPRRAAATTGSCAPSWPRCARSSGIDFSQYKRGHDPAPAAAAPGGHRHAAAWREYRAYLERQPEELRSPDQRLPDQGHRVLPRRRSVRLSARRRCCPRWSRAGRGSTGTSCGCGARAAPPARRPTRWPCWWPRRWATSWTRGRVRIFATDLDREAIDFARRGVYPAARAGGGAARAAWRATALAQDGSLRGDQGGARPAGLRRARPGAAAAVPAHRPVPVPQRADLLHPRAAAARAGGVRLCAARRRLPGPGQGGDDRPAARPISPPVDAALRVYRRQGRRDAAAARRAREPLDPVRARAGPRRARRGAAGAGPACGGEAPGRRSGADRGEELLLRLPVGVAVVDRRYDILRINNAARRLLGIHGEALGEDLVHLARGVPAQELRAAIDAALAGEEAHAGGDAEHGRGAGRDALPAGRCQPATPAPQTGDGAGAAAWSPMSTDDCPDAAGQATRPRRRRGAPRRIRGRGRGAPTGSCWRRTRS